MARPRVTVHCKTVICQKPVFGYYTIWRQTVNMDS